MLASRGTSPREASVAALAFGLLSLAFLSRGIPPGVAPVCTDPLYADPQAVPYREVRPEGFEPKNPYLSDHANVFFPWFLFMSRAVRGGELPLWSPESSGGLPFMANLSSALFFPTTWLAFLPQDLVSVARGVFLGAVLRLLLAGLFGYLLLRRVGLGRAASAAGGSGLMLFGYQVTWLFYSLSNVACLIPLCLYLTQRFAERPSAGRGALLSVGLALQFLGGHAETSLSLALAVSVWFLVAMRSAAPLPAGPMLLRFAGAGAAALALCSFQLLPFLEYLARSQGRFERSQVVPPEPAALAAASAPGLLLVVFAAAASLFAWRRARRETATISQSLAAGLTCGLAAGLVVAALAPLGLRALPLLLFEPDLFGHPTIEGYRGPEAYPDVTGGYAGALLLILALAAAVASRRRALSAGMVSLLVFAVVMTGRVEPLFGWIHAVPPFGLAAETRFLPLAGVGIAVLGALAIDEFRVRPGAMRGALVRVGCAVPVAALVASCAARLAPGEQPPRHGAEAAVRLPGPGAVVSPEIDARGRGRLVIPIEVEPPEHAVRMRVLAGGGVIHDRPVAGGRARFEWDASRLPAGRYPLRSIAVLSDGREIELPESSLVIDRALRVPPRGWVRVALVVLALAIFSRRPRLFVLAPACVAVELFWFGFDYNAFVPEKTVFPPTGVTDFLARERARLEAEGQGPPRVLCEDAILQPNQHYAYGLHVLRGYDQMEVRDFHRAIANMPGFAGVPRQTWNHETLDLGSPYFALLGLRYIVTGAEIDHPAVEPAYEGPGGRVYRVPGALPRCFVVGRAVDAGSTSPRELLQLDPREVCVVDGPVPRLGGEGSARVARYGLDEVVIDVEADGDALLVLMDNRFPGWTATVNGERRPILRAYGTFRAVPVPAGVSVVRFRYRPVSFLAGLALALASLGILAWLILSGRRSDVVAGA